MLTKRHSIDPKIGAKWRKRTTTTNAPIESKTAQKEVIVVAFHEHTLLPLDDCLYAL